MTVTPNNLADPNYIAPVKVKPLVAEKSTDLNAPTVGIPRRASRAQIRYLGEADGLRLTVDGESVTLPPNAVVSASLDCFGGDSELSISFSAREVEIIRDFGRKGRRTKSRARRNRIGRNDREKGTEK